MNENKKNRRVAKSGSYILAVSVVVVAIVIALNFVVSKLPTKNTELDITEKQLYTIGETTEAIVADLSDDVTMYYLVEDGKESPTVEKMLDSYAVLSDRLTLKKVDPAVNPNFASQYTTDSVSSGSVIFTSEKRSTVVDSGDLYKYSVDGYGEMSYDEFSQYYQYASYYGSTPSYTAVFYGEQAFTSAINYVTTDNIPSLYYTTGHGEKELDSKYAEYVSAENYNYQPLSLLSEDIPDDAEAILINVVTSDLSADETAKLEEYVKNGGDVVVISEFSTFTAEKLPNIAKLLETFGMKAAEGLVLEGDSRYCLPSYPAYYILPIIGEDSEYSPVSRLASTNINVFMPYAHGIVSTEAENVEVTEILHTSDSAFIKTELNENTDFFNKEDGDVEGRFAVAAAAQYTDGGRVVWYSSDAIVDPNADQYVGGGNSSLFIATLNMMAGKTETISIIGKNVSVSPLTVTEASVKFWRIALEVVLPIVILAAGFTVWTVRRRR